MLNIDFTNIFLLSSYKYVPLFSFRIFGIIAAKCSLLIKTKNYLNVAPIFVNEESITNVVHQYHSMSICFKVQFTLPKHNY